METDNLANWIKLAVEGGAGEQDGQDNEARSCVPSPAADRRFQSIRSAGTIRPNGP